MLRRNLSGACRANRLTAAGAAPERAAILRLIAIPVYAILILNSTDGHSWPAAILFAAAAITDQFDGFLARRRHVESEFGKIADPLADRPLIDVAVILLWHGALSDGSRSRFPARDVFVMVLTPFALGRGYKFQVNSLGKLAT